MPRIYWTEEQDNGLKNLHATGHSFDQICRELGGKTRNAVAGRCFRLGLRFDPTMPRAPLSPELIAERRANSKRNLTGLFRASVVRVEAVTPMHIGIAALDRPTCHYVYGEAGNRSYCGHGVQHKSSYCPYHHGIVYQVGSNAKRAA